MKFLHYYASPELKMFENEQPNPLELATSQITKEMVLAIVSRHARGRTPYYFEVPSSILFDAHQWRIPTTLLLIDPKYEREDDVSPVSSGVIVFHSDVVRIHARRVKPF